MEQREMICIACPVGCRLTVKSAENGKVQVTGHTCKRGEVYGKQEFTDPQRMVTTSVWVDGGIDPLVSVRTSQPIQKAKIGKALDELREVRLAAPVCVGDVVIENVADTGVSVIATRNC